MYKTKQWKQLFHMTPSDKAANKTLKLIFMFTASGFNISCEISTVTCFEMAKLPNLFKQNKEFQKSFKVRMQLKLEW